jgi:hypothetical protein
LSIAARRRGANIGGRTSRGMEPEGDDTVAKGQQRQPKEKKKPKADKNKPKPMSAYKQAQTQSFGTPTVNPLSKKI